MGSCAFHRWELFLSKISLFFVALCCLSNLFGKTSAALRQVMKFVSAGGVQQLVCVWRWANLSWVLAGMNSLSGKQVRCFCCQLLRYIHTQHTHICTCRDRHTHTHTYTYRTLFLHWYKSSAVTLSWWTGGFIGHKQIFFFCQPPLGNSTACHDIAYAEIDLSTSHKLLLYVILASFAQI